MPPAPIRIVNHSELDPHWNWLASAMHAEPGLEWQHVSTLTQRAPALPVVGPAWRRAQAANQAVHAALAVPRALLVSHGPRPAMYAAWVGGVQLSRAAEHLHLVFSFNFTTLPQGLRRAAMARAFQRVHRFTVSSTLEKDLYARVFDIEPARIDMLHWSVQPYDRAGLAPVVAESDYLCAVGSQARDYATLLQAMRRIPHRRLHLVASPKNLKGLSLPDNVTVHTGVSFEFCKALVAHARLMVLPLNSSEVPCGHVTAVMAMHLGTSIVATDSVGLHDYLRDGETAWLVPPHDAHALALSIEKLMAEEAESAALSERARQFALEYCVETRAVSYLRDVVLPCLR